MTDVFGRVYNLHIATTDLVIAQHTKKTGYEYQGRLLPASTTSIYTDGYIDYLTIEQSITISNPIQLKATINYGGKSGQDQMTTIELMGLSDATKAAIVANKVLLLEVGYETDETLPTLYVGHIESVHSDRHTTYIRCKEGGNVIKTVNVYHKFRKSQTHADVFNYFIKQFGENGVPFGGLFTCARTDLALGENRVVSSTLVAAITDFCTELDYVWFISKGKLYIRAKDLDRITDIVTLSEQNIVGNIERADDKTAKPTDDKSNKGVGVKLKLYMNAEIGMNTYIKIPFGEFEGDYKPTSITYHLNWKQGPWQIALECVPVSSYDLQQL